MPALNWWNDGTRSSDWAVAMAPILVRQARSEHPLTYGAVARELGMSHHWPVQQRAAGWIAEALGEIGKMKGWRRRPPPPLQSLIVNKATGLPGHGVNKFMSRSFRQARTKRQRAAALLRVHGEIYAYSHWEEVLGLLGVEPPHGLDNISEEATNSGRGGGEGSEHRTLKDFVACHPEIVGLSASQATGLTEQPLPSGDVVDVLFEGKAWRMAVEIKSHISSEGDMARGVYQCVKYRAVLNARSSVADKPYDVSVTLVLGGSAPAGVTRLAHAFSIPIIQNVFPG
ncbi:hypothetical protein [uncultured Sphingomonas sp.]|uniref:hypothetical protein n=1 Tax=uncultured Sphingomonas sp. TaxID=158754 RepID=UPI0035C9D447